MDIVLLRRRAALEILIFISLVALTALLLKPVAAYLEKRMNILRDSLVFRAESMLNRKIRYASARPSLFGSLDIREISVFKDGEEPLLQLDTFALGFSLFDLLTGKKEAAIRSLTLEGLSIVYDIDKDRDLLELLNRASEKRPDTAFTLPPDCVLRIRNGSLILKKEEKSLRVSGLSFDGAVQDGRVTLDGNWHTEAALAENCKPVTVDGGLEGDFAADFSSGSLALNISAFKGETFTLGNLRFDVSIKDNSAVLKNSGGPYDFALAYNFDTASVSGEFKAANFTCAEILSFTGAWKRYDYWLDLAFTGTASFSAGAGEDFRYRFDMQGSGTPEVLAGFDLAGSGTGEALVFERCRFEFNRGSLDYRGDLSFNPLIPQGALVLSGFSLTGNSGISGEIRLVRTEKSLELASGNVSVGNARFFTLSGGMNWENAGFSYRLSLIRAGKGGAAAPSLALNGSYDLTSAVNGSAGQRTQGSLALNAFSLEDLRRMIEPFHGMGEFPGIVRDSAENVSLTAEIFISTDFSHITYSVPRYLAVYKGFSEIRASGSLSGADRRFEIFGGRIDWKDGSAEASLQADFSSLDDISVQVQASYKDFTYYFEGVFFDRQTVSIRGSYGVSVYVSAASPGGYSGYAKIESAPVPFRGGTARLVLDASIRYDSASFWTLDVNKLELNETPEPAATFTVFSLSGHADQDGLAFNNISWKDRFGELSGSINAGWEQDFSGAEGRVDLNGRNGERCLIEAAYREDGSAVLPGREETGKTVFNALFTGIHLERFIGGARNGRLSGVVSGFWKGADSYVVDIALESLEIPGGTMPLSLAASGLINQNRINVSATRFNIGELSSPEFALTVDRLESSFELTGLFDGNLNGKQAGLDASLNADFIPIDNWLDMEKALGAFSGSLNVKSAHIRDKTLKEPCSFWFSAIRDDDSGLVLNVSGGPGDMLRLELLENGNLYADLSAPSPVQGYLSGTIKDFNIEAMATDVYIDLPALWALLPMEEVVVFTGGFITGETRITGSLQDPEFYGKAWGSGIRLTIPQYIAAEIGPGSGAVALEGSEFSFGPLKGRCGNGSGEITAAFRFNRWTPSFDMAITVPETESIPYAFNLAGVKSSGSASGNLTLNLENNEILTITGNVNAGDAQITLNAEELQTGRDNPRRAGSVEIVANVHINAGRRVEFIWPNEDLPVIRAYGAAGSGITITSDTRIPAITLDGDISLLGGEIYYFQRSFFIRQGQVYFNPNDLKIDPYISARAEIRDRTTDGPVIISLIVDNSRLSSLSPRFESSPSLSQLEIYSLLGQTPAEGQQSEVLVRSMADMLTQFILIRQVEREIRNILGLDMFTVRTQVLQNALLTALGSSNSVSAAADPDNPNYRSDRVKNSAAWGNYFDNTAVFMGKYLAPELFAQAMVAMRYDPNREQWGGVRFEPDIGIDLHSPFVDIRWNLSPRNIESVTVRDLIKDQSVSLVWRWSF